MTYQSIAFPARVRTHAIHQAFVTLTDMMSYPDVEQPPLKKRRFFAEESPPPETERYSKVPSGGDASSTYPTYTKDSSQDGIQNTSSQLALESEIQSTNFDKKIIESFLGQEISGDTLQKLQELSGNDIERAINMFLDGSYASTIAPSDSNTRSEVVHADSSSYLRDSRRPKSTKGLSVGSSPTIKQPEVMPEYRYVGAFGVGGWATRSGLSAIKHGDVVKIERTKIKPPVKIGRGGKVIPPLKGSVARMRTDIIVRFTTTNGEEVGRLPQDTALWVSTLMDQKICRFDGICVFVPDRVRVNDTIYLQLKCSLLKRAFESSGFIKPEDNNRTTGVFEEKETSEEKDLRLRQVALVKLFDEVNLHPISVNETTAKHKREGILQAAEVAEQYDKEKDTKQPEIPQLNGSSPPSEEEEEDGKELEQDQLDSLYKKAQSFDFDTPTREPTGTFVMNLRKYQKQALHWMISKEKDEKSDNREVSMHPLWEEYHWPVKDMDDQELPRVAGQDSFYVNPYSGELSLSFPLQEQHCLGGILADGRHCLTRS